MDPPLIFHGFPTLLNLKKLNKQESFIYTFPGFLGLCGMSENIGVACNGISMLNHRKDGLPVAFIMRKLLTFKNENDAFEWIQNIPHATPQSYTIGGKTQVKCFECSANSVVEFYPFKNKEVCLHTNFANRSTDFSKKYLEFLLKRGKSPTDYYCARYSLAFEKIKEFDFQMDSEKIKSILRLNEPRFQPISNPFTYGCIIMNMSENPEIQLAPGQPHQTEFICLKLAKN